MRNSTKFLTIVSVILLLIFICIFPLFSLIVGITLLGMAIIIYPFVSIIEYYTMMEYEKQEYKGWNPLIKILLYLDYGRKRK